MPGLVSDVRERDRALRDGTWVDEFEMRDAAPRKLAGWIFVVAFVVLLLSLAGEIVYKAIFG